MLLNMFELRRLPKGRDTPVQRPQPFMNRRISRSYISNVALKMLDVDGVEADDCCVEPNISFGDVCAEIVGGGVFGEMGLDAVEGGEEGSDGSLVGFLSSAIEDHGEDLGIF